jgi:hypothetical protein
MENDITIKSFCNQCYRETDHVVRHIEPQDYEEEDKDGILLSDFSIRHEIIKCRGCQNVSFRQRSWGSEIGDEESLVIFPPRIFRRLPPWLSELPAAPFLSPGLPPSNKEKLDIKEFIEDLLNEIYVCIQNDCRRSAAMATRALLDQVMVDKIGDKGTFENKMTEFANKKFISPADRDTFLETGIEAGSAATHRGFKPTKEDLITLIDIVESVIKSVYLPYINEYRANQLKARIPPDKRRRLKDGDGQIAPPCPSVQSTSSVSGGGEANRR